MSSDAYTRELLAWIADGPRRYGDAIEVWKTSCPRFSVWDDALSDGLVQVWRDANGSWVTVTPRGRAILEDPPAR